MHELHDVSVATSPFSQKQLHHGSIFINIRIFQTNFKLATVFTPYCDDPDPEIDRLLASMPNTTQNTNILTLQGVQNGIKALNIKNSPGPDLVTPKMLKELPRKGLIPLLYIFNGILRTQYWPRVLKTVEIIVIPKPGKDLIDPTSYRPVSLLSTISKVLERLLANKITTDQNT
jgi:hypothetical protein